jgi:RNA polymerase sigma-70 factor (ECF subfamily)
MSHLLDEKYESFLKLYRANESFISRYVLVLCPNYSAAEDIVQETMLVMWRKYGQYRPGTNFAAWGMRIARFCVSNYFRKEKSRVVYFGNEAFENITEYGNYIDLDQEAYLEALEECTMELPENSKKMIILRYVENMKVTDIALKMQKTLSSTYKIMSRIHHTLLTCIERKLAKDGIV